ncbi:MAG: LON peptidase substrate-binding domain-containing protein, partial [Planctomycetota bacterium]
MFPLPGVYLFPNAIMPLRIFEPRYQAMIEDLLDTAGRFVLASIQAGHESEIVGSPPVDRVVGLGEITRHEKLPNGDFLIVLQGLGRYAIEEVE